MYASLFKLNATHPLLATSANYAYSLSGTFRYLQLADTGIAITVIGNFDVNSASGNVTFQNAGTWYNYLGADSIAATGSSQSITLDPGEYKVYINKNLNDTSSGTVVTPPPPDTASVNGIKIYPSPVVNNGSVITYTLSSQDNVTLALYNMMGQQAGLFYLGSQASGTHIITFGELPFNINSLKNGAYVLRLISSQKTSHVEFSVLH